MRALDGTIMELSFHRKISERTPCGKCRIFAEIPTLTQMGPGALLWMELKLQEVVAFLSARQRGPIWVEISQKPNGISWRFDTELISFSSTRFVKIRFSGNSLSKYPLHFLNAVFNYANC